ncbi:MAG: AmmeMemoRadiSam system protein B, partial [Desulfobacterota bacterium]|nr:AmmeMemoRadiSam system protein B [Thermodesulfobacteriota bacterium]
MEINKLTTDYPKLREVEVFPVKAGEHELICLRDPYKITEELVVIPQSAYFIVRLFDGKHSIRDIQAEWMRQFGELIYSDQIVEIVAHLNSHFLLDNENFKEQQNKLKEEFFNSPLRKPILVGQVYESDPEKLRQQIESYYFLSGGPGYGPRPQAFVNNLKGLIVPHIDYQRGGTCYAWGYKELAEDSNHEVFILLGTSHVATEKYFVLTRKDFDTPFGVIPSDQEIISQLENKLGRDFFVDEFVHRNEHSLELQVIYLEYLFEKAFQVRIVPI